MTADRIHERFREVAQQSLPNPGEGKTANRHRALMEIARENVSLARLAEAHFDALAILAEAGREAVTGATYTVWAAEIPGKPLALAETRHGLSISGTKMFCSGAEIVDRALVTAGAPSPWLVEIDLHAQSHTIAVDNTDWKTSAFAATNTATITFTSTKVVAVETRGWYLERLGFWHGACGPAACWAGAAVGAIDYAKKQSRHDPHTLAHLGAMEAAAWTMNACLQLAGDEIDQWSQDKMAARERALKCRHQIEQSCTDILQRFGRAYGPYPLAIADEVSSRCLELTIYLRQCHAERDLAVLGESILEREQTR